jgi:hypothetical protein
MSLCRWCPAALLAAVLALGALAAPAAARIVPFKSIAGLDLGISEAAVRAEVGEPTRVQEGPDVGHRTLVYARRRLWVVIANEQVGAVRTRSRGHRTRDGLGVGTGLARLRSKLRGERCHTLPRHMLCSVHRPDAVMSYVVTRGRVSEVQLSSSGPRRPTARAVPAARAAARTRG